MLGLGIESTCDESSIALVEDGTNLIHCNTYSQIKQHEIYRGVVPEIASRAHLEKLNQLLDETLAKSGVNLPELDYIAVANRPGLMGSIMMGAQLARCISMVHSIPLVPVHHLEAHLSVVRLEEGNSDLEFPILGVLLSGGNSAIFIQKGWGDVTILADTLDDALGEAFDKAAAIMNLGYPGGPCIEKEAEDFITRNSRHSPKEFFLPRLLKSDSAEKIQFSFSGLKTALLYAMRDRKNIEKSKLIGQLSYEFQKVSFELVTRNILKSVQATGIRTVVMGGGVLANSALRIELDKLSQDHNVRIVYPKSKFLCTDNAAMIACLGYYKFLQGEKFELDFPISPRGQFTLK
jgi:N6-L-threonylcarbamoyladenine synthase